MTITRIKNLLSQMEGDYSFDKLKSLDLNGVLGKENAEKVIEKANDGLLQNYLDSLEEKGVEIVTRESEFFPQKLLRVESAPYYLFCKGNLDLLQKPCVSIVGTRTPTNYGRIVTEKFAGELSEAGVVIVSGLAYGVDGIAHRKALDTKGKTIAVLGGGFEHIYPSVHTNLAREIAEVGLLVSEYSPSYLPSKFTFPQRNRIVAGLSDGVLITEAGEKSGTLITKDFAIDSGITVYAVPGNITSDASKGTNSIIATMQGVCTLSAKDILKDLGITETKKRKIVQLSIEEEKIVGLLTNGEKDIEFLSENVDFDIKKLNSLLTTLEIKSIIKKMPGGFYALG